MRTLLTFAANETSKTVSVPTTDDSADEEDETFTLTLSSPANATLGGAAATGTIEDDDDAPPPLPASFEGMPGAHDGESAFTHLCREAGLVKLGHVAVDSTKVRANASKHKAMSFARMKEEEKKLQAEIRSWFEECAEVDAAEDALYGLDKTGDEWPAELADPKRRLHKIQEAKAALEAEAQAKGEEEPKPKAQRNFTDPDSRIMLSSDKVFIQAYNCHVAVDADS